MTQDKGKNSPCLFIGNYPLQDTRQAGPQLCSMVKVRQVSGPYPYLSSYKPVASDRILVSVVGTE